MPTLITCLTIFLGNLYHLLLTIFFVFVFGSLYNFCRLDLTKDGAVSLSANHLQKLRLSFQLTTPLGHVFKPHQVCSFLISLYYWFFSVHFFDLLTSMQAFFKLKHESQVEHIFLVKTSGKKSELVLVKFLKLHSEMLLQIKFVDLSSFWYGHVWWG